MKSSKKILTAAVAAATMATVSLAPVANAEVGASVGVASTYLWRGMDLGSGTPQVQGDINYSLGGGYVGTWVSSGDTAAGTEYDLYLGYGNEFGAFNFDLSVWSYNYPTASEPTTGGEYTDVVLGLGYGPVGFAIYEPIGSEATPEYRYLTLDGSVGAFSLLVGAHLQGEVKDEGIESYSGVHADLTYSFNDNLSFTLSQFINDADKIADSDAFSGNFGNGVDRTKVVVAYTLPIQ